MEISGKVLRDAIISGANNIINHKNEVDELNVFPVPDGDTGTNMSMTIRNAVPELRKMDDSVSISTVVSAAAAGMLRGARGNSGVILSLLFRGLSKGLAGKETMNAKDLTSALERGVASAYKSVMKPTEGTILTVSREASEAASKKAAETDDVAEVLGALVEEAQASLERTPELLPALKKAGVVDSGGMGFVLIFSGIYGYIARGEMTEEQESEQKHAPATIDPASAAAVDTKLQYTYNTEFVIKRSDGTDDPVKLRAYLGTIGDNISAAEGDGIIKVHIHTDHPGKALEKAILFGMLTDIKIENMREQHETQQMRAENAAKSRLAPAKPENEFGIVAVANGAGLEAVFTDLGADAIVRGGQTSNPSTEDIVEAVMAAPAKNVFVLPNNKNIILAAEQAMKIVKDRKVIVLQSRSIPQGIAALMAFDPSADRRTNSTAMTAALDNVNTGLVTFAVRDSSVEDKKIKQGDILGMENGRLAVVDRDITKVLYKVTKHLLTGSSSFVTVFYGSDVSDDDAQTALAHLRSKLSDDIEFTLISGGQPVYYYIVSVE